MNFPFLFKLVLGQFLVLLPLNWWFIKKAKSNHGSSNTPVALYGFIHGLFCLMAPIPYLLSSYTLGGKLNEQNSFFLHITLSFLITHSLFMISNLKPRADESIHHIICIATIVYALTTGNLGDDLLMTVVLGELACVFYLRIACKNHQLTTWLPYIDRYLDISTPISRLIAFPIYFVLFIRHPSSTFLQSFLAGLFTLLGVYWGILRLKGVKDGVALRSSSSA